MSKKYRFYIDNGFNTVYLGASEYGLECCDDPNDVLVDVVGREKRDAKRKELQRLINIVHGNYEGRPEKVKVEEVK